MTKQDRVEGRQSRTKRNRPNQESVEQKHEAITASLRRTRFESLTSCAEAAHQHHIFFSSANFFFVLHHHRRHSDRSLTTLGSLPLRLPPNEARNAYILRPCFWGLALDHVSTFNALKIQPRSTYQEHFNNQIQKPRDLHK